MTERTLSQRPPCFEVSALLSVARLKQWVGQKLWCRQCFHLMKVNITDSACMDGWLLDGLSCSLYNTCVHSGINDLTASTGPQNQINQQIWGDGPDVLNMYLLVFKSPAVSFQGQFLCNQIYIQVSTLIPVTPTHTWRHKSSPTHTYTHTGAGKRHRYFSFCLFGSLKWIAAVSSTQGSFISRQGGRQGCDSCLREETNGQPDPQI